MVWGVVVVRGVVVVALVVVEIGVGVVVVVLSVVGNIRECQWERR